MTRSGVNLINVAVVLLRPKLAENVGTAARAAANMGLGRLIVVQPPTLEDAVMKAAATKCGRPLIDNLTVYNDLKEALAGFNHVVGTTARLGSHRGPFIAPRDLAHSLIGPSRDHKIALLFGPERTGLTTAELRLCQSVVTIPTASDEASSLNLAQAVLILGYELLLARSDEKSSSGVKLAPTGELEAMYEHMKEAFLDIGFLPEDNPDHFMMSFKRIFNRAGLTHGDCNLMRGLSRQIINVVKYGQPPGKRGDRARELKKASRESF